jgi:hypothetical protein
VSGRGVSGCSSTVSLKITRMLPFQFFILDLLQRYTFRLLPSSAP